MGKDSPKEPPSKSPEGVESLQMARSEVQPKTSTATPGMAIKRIEKGKTTQAEIAQIFGPPDVVTKGALGEMWSYDKVSGELAEAATGARVGVASASGTPVEIGGVVGGAGVGALGGVLGGIGGSSGQSAAQSQQQSRRTETMTTVFLLVYYDDKGVVTDYRLSATKF